MIVIADLSMTHATMKALKTGSNLLQVLQSIIQDVVADSICEPVVTSRLPVEIRTKERGRCDRVVHSLLIEICAWNMTPKEGNDTQKIGETIKNRLIESTEADSSSGISLQKFAVLFRYAP